MPSLNGIKKKSKLYYSNLKIELESWKYYCSLICHQITKLSGQILIIK